MAVVTVVVLIEMQNRTALFLVVLVDRAVVVGLDPVQEQVEEMVTALHQLE
tara:strand:+ start:492 stop:644 length:153 start_codon:yes stop_codon:yes gene_type:complete